VPLTNDVEFKAVLQRGNRVQVPKLVRWEFKMETNQDLKIRVSRPGAYGLGENFYGRMNRDGRLTIPRLTLVLLQNKTNGGKSLIGCILGVQLKPAGQR
jgi:hypothetical protein